LPFVAGDDVAAGQPIECFDPVAVIMREKALPHKQGHAGAARSKQRKASRCWAIGNRSAHENPIKLVLPDRIELSTSPLPMECSTTELRQRAPD
jgi:hypothetical protein